MVNNFNGITIFKIAFVLAISNAFSLTAVAEPPAPVPRTGQTTCYDQNNVPLPTCPGTTGQDADKRAGVAWPDPRFTDNKNGTVTDNLTGLIWLKDAHCSLQPDAFELTWQQALNAVNALASGKCGLTDGSTAGQWRLPNIRELRSLIDHGRAGPALPEGHPFEHVQLEGYYWSSTSDISYPSDAWYVYVYSGADYSYSYSGKSAEYYVWPVRGGQLQIGR